MNTAEYSMTAVLVLSWLRCKTVYLPWVQKRVPRQGCTSDLAGVVAAYRDAQ